MNKGEKKATINRELGYIVSQCDLGPAETFLTLWLRVVNS